MLDDGDHAGGQEPGRAHRLAGPGHLGDLDHGPRGGHLDPPPGSGGHDLEPAHPAGAGVAQHLDLVSTHTGQRSRSRPHWIARPLSRPRRGRPRAPRPSPPPSPPPPPPPPPPGAPTPPPSPRSASSSPTRNATGVSRSSASATSTASGSRGPAP